MEGLPAAVGAELARAERAVTAGMAKAAEGLRKELSVQTIAALGPRLGQTWKANVYPKGGVSMEPAGFVYSKIPKIIDFNSASRVVTPVTGEALAIPTRNVPRGRRGRRLSPVEVEAHFNAELRPVRLPSGRIGLVIDVVAGLSQRRPGFRLATKGRLKQGRRPRPVLMFVLVRRVVGRRLIDVEGVAARWAQAVPRLIEQELDRAEP